MKKSFLITAFLIFLTCVLKAQEGTADPSFITGNGASIQIIDVEILSDGSKIVCGYFTNYDGQDGYNYIAKLDADGNHDLTWPSGSEFPDQAVEDIEVLPNGKILLGGSFLKIGTTLRYRIARSLSDLATHLINY